MYDVKAAGAEPEVEGLRVDDHLVACLRAPDEGHVCDGSAALPLLLASGQLDDQPLLGARAGRAAVGGRVGAGGVVGLDDDGGAEL